MADDVLAFGHHLADGLSAVLTADLVGAYFVGSVALGGYVAGESDIDVAAVCQHALGDQAKQSVVDAVERTLEFCPTRGLEFTVYRRDVAGSPPRGADFEVNVNGGPGMERAVHLHAETESPFWYILDRGIAHRRGVAIIGPPAAGVFADIDRPALLRAMLESMRWHREHEPASLYSVLNAARAWRFAETDDLGSKLEGAAWAAERWHEPGVITAAVELRRGRRASLDASDVDALLDHVEHVLSKASEVRR